MNNLVAKMMKEARDGASIGKGGSVSKILKPNTKIDSFTLKMPPRWTPLREHPEQTRAWQSNRRFNIVPSGRRSGKTEIIGKRKMVMRFMLCHDPKFPQYFSPYPDPTYFIAAPTRDQVKRIYWADIKKLIPKGFLACDPNESNLYVTGKNGAQLWLLGLDKPERVEGSPWDWGLVDEIANVKPDAWAAHIRPALSDRNGGCDFIGVPEGRNHYYEMDQNAQADDTNTWGRFHWFSSDILPEWEIEQAKRDLDELTYQQEYEGSFVVFAGLAYYAWNPKLHVGRVRKFYSPTDTLIFTFDFNVSPGTASIIQEHSDGDFKRKEGRDVARTPSMEKRDEDERHQTTTLVLGEVHIPKNSNTERVCNKLIEDWGSHRGIVECYGDATGGAKGTAKVKGTDWDLIKAALYPVFGERLKIKLRSSNPRERMRVNSVNSRLKSMSGESRIIVDGHYAPNIIKDFEGVRVIEGSAGELDKSEPMLTHLTDGIGYYIAQKFPIIRKQTAEGY